LKNRLQIVLAIVVLCNLAMGVSIADEEPTEEEKKQLAVKLTRLLEKDPFHEDAKEMRKWLTFWLIEVPDVSVSLCGSFLGPVFDKNQKNSAELFVQSGYAQAVFIIENPEQADNAFEAYKAGLLGTLRTYESILASKPKAQLKYMDHLIELRDNGALDDYVREKMKECEG